MKQSILREFSKPNQEYVVDSHVLDTLSDDEREDRFEKKFIGLMALGAGVFAAQSVLRGEGDMAVQLFNAAVAAGALALSSKIAIGLQVSESGSTLDDQPEDIILADMPLDPDQPIAA